MHIRQLGAASSRVPTSKVPVHHESWGKDGVGQGARQEPLFYRASSYVSVAISFYRQQKACLNTYSAIHYLLRLVAM